MRSADASQQARRVSIHAAFHNPMLAIGGERDLLVVITILLAMLMFAGASWTTTVVSLACWVLGIVALQRLAKVDPQFSRVYLRHLRYRSQYAASSHAVAMASHKTV